MESALFEDGDPDNSDDEKDSGNKKDPDDQEQTSEVQKRLLKLYETKCHNMSWKGFEDFELTVLGEKFRVGDISQEHVEKWNAATTDSLFGNVALQETQHDATVRSSRELDTTQFEVGKDLLNAIAKKWEKKLTPKAVSVKPYRLLIYGAGDHFQYHKDTQEENLCGTFLVARFSNSKPADVFELSDKGTSVFWGGSRIEQEA